MNKKTFLEKFSGRKWSYLIEIPEVEQVVRDYSNENTIRNYARMLNYFLEEIHKTQEEYQLTNLLSLTPKEARTIIWNVCQSIMAWDDSNRVAQQVKTWLTQFYEFHSEKKLVWKRHHTISVIPQWTDRHIPSHKDIFLIADHCMNLRDKSIVLQMYNTGISHKAIGNIKVKHMRPILEKYKKDKEIPLVLKITADIYPKRFRSNNGFDYFPSLIDKDCADILLRYYEEERKDAEDSEYFYVNRDNEKLTTHRISVQIGRAIERATIVNPKLKKSYPYLIRHSFFNRLVAGNMKDIYREFLMMHTLKGQRDFYFDNEYQKDEIIQQYKACNFNRKTEIDQMEEKITDLTEKAKEYDELKNKVDKQEKRTSRLGNLEKEVNRLREIVGEYEVMLRVPLHDGRILDLRPRDLRLKDYEPSIMKIRKDDVDKYIELKSKGYVKTLENSEYIVMEKT